MTPSVIRYFQGVPGSSVRYQPVTSMTLLVMLTSSIASTMGGVDALNTSLMTTPPIVVTAPLLPGVPRR